MENEAALYLGALCYLSKTHMKEGSCLSQQSHRGLDKNQSGPSVHSGDEELLNRY